MRKANSYRKLRKNVKKIIKQFLYRSVRKKKIFVGLLFEKILIKF